MFTKPRAITLLRVLFGLAFTVFGLDGFLHFIPAPKELPSEGAMALGLAFLKSGYLFQLIKGTELVCGLLLLANRFVPLALVLLAPVIVNIVAFHLFLAPSGLVLALVFLAAELGLAWENRASYRPLLVGRN